METLNGILIWIGSNTTFVIVAVVVIIIYAIHKGFAMTHPKFEVTSLNKDGVPFRLKGSQFYAGPGQYGPSGDKMLEGGAKVVEHLAGNSQKRLPGPDNDVLDTDWY